MSVINGTSAPDTLDGTISGDTMHGNGGDDLLRGQGGDDVIYGDAGDDLLWGGTGVDIVHGGDGDDQILVGNDAVYGEAGDDYFELESTSNFGLTFTSIVDGGDGFDYLETSPYGYGGMMYLDQGIHAGGFNVSNVEFISLGDTAWTVYGGEKDDIILGGLHSVEIHGGGGLDLIVGLDGDDLLYGDGGDDLIDGGLGDDRIDGGAGFDIIDYSAADFGLTINLQSTSAQNTGHGVDTLTNIEGLYGSNYADVLTGNASDNMLDGGLGNDVLDGGAGADELWGGLGDDAYWVDNVGDLVQEFAGEGFDTVASFVSYTLAADIEKLLLLGSAINATGNSGGNILVGNALANTLDAGASGDILDGGAGADTLIGGSGDDSYWIDNTGDQIIEQAGQGFDTVASFVSYTLSANVEKLILLGSAGFGVGSAQTNIMVGNALDNTLDGGGGADWMEGGVGADAYWVDNVGDTVVELAGEGFDTVASFVSYTLAANVEKLLLLGSAVTATGNSGGNILVGNALANTLDAGASGDILDGGAGADTMIGGTGDDSYWVDDAGDQIVEQVGQGFETVASFASYTIGANVEKLILLGSAVSATGNATANILVGDALANTINGMGGDDWLEGGMGADTFVLAPGAGHDRIVDFGLGGERDALNVAAYIAASVTWTVAQQGADTLVAFANGDSVLLEQTLSSHVVQSGGELAWI